MYADNEGKVTVLTNVDLVRVLQITKKLAQAAYTEVIADLKDTLVKGHSIPLTVLTRLAETTKTIREMS
jgi:hypothetical protein